MKKEINNSIIRLNKLKTREEAIRILDKLFDNYNRFDLVIII